MYLRFLTVVLLIFSSLLGFTKNKGFIRILHITDLHIDYFYLFSRDYYRNIFLLKSNIDLIRPDVVILSGDIFEFGEGIFSSLNYSIFTNIFHFSNGNFYFDNDREIPLYVIPGNHEYHSFFKLSYNDIPNYKRFFGSVLRNYFVDFDYVRIVFLDTGYDYYFSPWANNNILPEPESTGITYDQILFLEKSLSCSYEKLKIIVTHHPFLNYESGIEEGVFLFYRKEFYEILDKYNVNLVISGHTHNNKVYDINTNLVKSFPIYLDRIAFVQTGSIGKNGWYRVIDVFSNKIVVYASSNVDYFLLR
ncbi:MAG: metallophosphoesterase family protein [Brevinematia bacterium]